MRYNTYRQYKTLSGYDEKKISYLTNYIERNRQFQWQSYDLIKTIPSADFSRYIASTNYLQAGFRLLIVVGIDNFIRSIKVQKQTFSSSWNDFAVLNVEPNTYMFYINDPDAYSDSDREVLIKAYDQTGKIVTFTTLNGSASETNLYVFSAAWTYLPNASASSTPYTILAVHKSSNVSTEAYRASNVDYFSITYTFDSNDTQESITPFVVYVPKFVPVE